MIKKTNRIAIVDALRGFAILCILIIHSSNHFLDGMSLTPESTIPFWKTLNSKTTEMLYFILEGKSYGIFALLFGVTFGIQYFGAREKGRDFRGRFLWRMVLLAGFGVLNAAFFAGGDVLFFMAITAIVLPFIAQLSSKALVLIAVFFLLQPLEWIQIIRLLFNPAYEPTSNLTGYYYPLLPPVLKTGDFFAMVGNNVTNGLRACLSWGFEFGRITQTPGLYIIGFLLYKHRRFVNITDNFWEKLTIITLLATPLLYVAKHLPQTAGGFKYSLQIIITMWYNLSFILLIVGLFVLLFRSGIFQRLTYPLRYYGKMSLTNYISQSIICTLLFYPYGLNLDAHIGSFLGVLVGGGVAVLQILFSRWWLKRHKQGPLEYLWHKGTMIGVKK